MNWYGRFMRQSVRRNDVMNEPTTEVQVLVAGAGPAGLTAAIALARGGVETLLLERRRERSSAPRATTASTATMELMRSSGAQFDAGVVDAVCQILLRHD